MGKLMRSLFSNQLAWLSLNEKWWLGTARFRNLTFAEVKQGKTINERHCPAYIVLRQNVIPPTFKFHKPVQGDWWIDDDTLGPGVIPDVPKRSTSDTDKTFTNPVPDLWIAAPP